MTENYIVTNMNRIRVKYISDIPSVFFRKGEEYEGFVFPEYKSRNLIAFFFSEEEMDEAGYYALPASRFQILDEEH